jgi:hypothetical protein
MSNLYENAAYEVRQIDNALSENGREYVDGYGIFNKDTGVCEATGLVLPECRWRADQFANMIVELDERQALQGNTDLSELAEGADEDVTLN